ncbi:hypothetical protein Thiowin_02377 [Thiorhodovibrio winogradskyi]|uniref:DUF4007 domain-containing protein n=1 Tax=Thiorhodovibrio winogradskyi TaxID=77007 RepID=A0ABZ0SA05_9GAMM|nr:hypothetical protein [Thiorhodovibrio winogradskyi]
MQAINDNTLFHTEAANSLRLPLNFPQTFLPERRLLAALLEFAQGSGVGDKETISAATGIPTGRSTGKVVPLIHYGLGMGLLTAAREGSQWQLELTTLGAQVRREDPYLSEPVTQWLLHLMLCRRADLGQPASGVADAWFLLLAEGPLLFGREFRVAAFHQALAQRHGGLGYLKGLSTLVPRMYTESACFGDAGVLLPVIGEEGAFVRASAPCDGSFYPAYALSLWQQWDVLFGDHTQISFDEFDRATRWSALLGWGPEARSDWLQWLVGQGWLQLDRYTGSPVLLRLIDSERLTASLYSGLV